jgi:hypothetical protein
MTESDATLRMLAHSLAPYIRDELRRLDALESQKLDPRFDASTCAEYVLSLGDGVLTRARTLFGLLAGGDAISSVQLAGALEVTPRALSGYLTTPLKRRAKALGLPLPFAGGSGDKPYGGLTSPPADATPDRTYWRDRDGIAQRMLTAIGLELARRASND